MRSAALSFGVAFLAAVSVACPAVAASGFEQVGTASWYGARHHGKKTASGEPFNMNASTAAHRTLPLGSLLEITNLDNERTVQVRVNDRGPYSGGRIVDVSKAVAEQLDFIGRGTARVRVRAVDLRGASEPEAPADDGAPELPEQPVAYTSLAGALPEPPLPTRVVPVSGEAYAVQAGTFSIRSNAETAASRLKATGVTEIRKVQLRGGEFHVVVVGVWAAREEADRARAAVAAVGFSDARVVSAF
ncbi:MAG TPA: septal ring lytic transglycosylase RlpA family protein [Caulobacteraceae bacterium]|jgi:rare lipoprotein A